MAKCLLCNSSEQDDVAYGELLQKDSTVVHEFCLYLSSGLVQNGKDDDGFFGFLPKDIMAESKRVQKLFCYFCHQNYANIGCCESKCRKTFHMVCGVKNGVENQFLGTFKSYCDYHARKPKCPPKNEVCCICYDKLYSEGVRNRAVNFIRAPCCQNGWFHKYCLQAFARSSGYFFKCPLCNNTDKFIKRMPYSGIFVRNADASWELEPNAFAELLQRPSKCEAEVCRNRKGREDVDNDRNPIICCETCGAVGSHKLCLPEGVNNFNCTECLQLAVIPSCSEGDSGRESTQNNGDSDENEEIDVCSLNDSVDILDILARNCSGKQLTESYEEAENGRNENTDIVSESEKLQNETKEEIPEKTIASTSQLKEQYFSYDSSDDEVSSEEFFSYNTHYGNRSLKRWRSLTDSDDDAIVQPYSRKNHSQILDDSSEDLENMPKARKEDEKKKQLKQIKNDNKDGDKIIENGKLSMSQSEMHCLVYEKKDHEKSPIELVSRYNACNERQTGLKRRLSTTDSDDEVNTPKFSLKQHNRIRDSDSSEDFENRNNEHGKEKDVKQSIVNGNTQLMTAQEAINPLDISCIANRTRQRKFIKLSESESEAKIYESKKHLKEVENDIKTGRESIENDNSDTSKCKRQSFPNENKDHKSSSVALCSGYVARNERQSLKRRLSITDSDDDIVARSSTRKNHSRIQDSDNSEDFEKMPKSRTENGGKMQSKQVKNDNKRGDKITDNDMSSVSKSERHCLLYDKKDHKKSPAQLVSRYNACNERQTGLKRRLSTTDSDDEVNIPKFFMKKHNRISDSESSEDFENINTKHGKKNAKESVLNGNKQLMTAQGPKSPLNSSCIASRTRQRKSIDSKTTSREHKDGEDNKKYTADKKRLLRSDSSDSFACSSDENLKEETNSLEISCIAKRTRHSFTRSSTNHLSPITEKVAVESYQAPNNSKRLIHESSKDDGFVSDNQSPPSTQHCVPVSSLKHSQKRPMRLVSTDDELERNDSMKNR